MRSASAPAPKLLLGEEVILVNEIGLDLQGGWRVGRFIPIELDVALSLANGYLSSAGMAKEFEGLLAPLSEDWKAEVHQILGVGPRLVSLLELATQCTGTTFEDDYVRALLPLRSLDSAGALELLLARTAKPAVTERSRDYASALQQLSDALIDLQIRSYSRAGLEISDRPELVESLRGEVDLIGRILKGGDLHDRFWHWLDRFFYEWYQPWRRGREELMAAAERRAVVALGSATSTAGVPRLDWLPPQNPLHLLPELKAAVVEQRVPVYFWIEPFGFADSSVMRAEAICVTCGEPGRVYAEFRKHAQAVASRAKALGDPTRLLILRLIRHFPLMNTELAEYLGIARPTASIHAKLLREAGLITSRQDGHAVRHEIKREEIRRLFEDLYRFLDLGPAPGRAGEKRGKDEN